MVNHQVLQPQVKLVILGAGQGCETENLKHVKRQLVLDDVEVLAIGSDSTKPVNEPGQLCSSGCPMEEMYLIQDDRLDVVGRGFLGLTLACAQCHDHKFDPISQRDFYSLAAFFADVEEKGDFAGSPNRRSTSGFR